MIIRPAKIEDAVEISNVLFNSWQSSFNNIVKDNFPLTIDKLRYAEKFRNTIINKTEEILVAINEIGKLIGFISGKKINNYCYEIIGLYIDSDYHNQGIGTNLIIEIQKIASMQNSNTIQVKTLKNAYNNSFYEKLGFIKKNEELIKIGTHEYQ